MTIAVTRTETDNVRISEHGHLTEWSIEIQPDQFDWIIERLQTIQKEIKDLTPLTP